MEYKTITFL